MVLLSRALAFAAIAALYAALGWLNLEQVGRIGLLGLADLLAVSAWTTRRHPETKVGKACVVATLFIFLLFMSYHGFLREFFGVAAADNAVLSAIFNSNRTEAGEFLEQEARPLLKHVIVVVALTSLFAFLINRWPLARRPEAPVPSRRRGWITAGAFLALFVIAHINPSMRNMDPVLYFPSRYQAWKAEIEAVAQLQARMAASASDPQLNTLRRADENPRTIVFMLSESVTRLNFPYVGYPRNTAPELEALGQEVTWFSDVVTSDGSTIPAVCKILTSATVREPDLWLTKPDLFLMARKAGYKTFWLSNHTTDGYGVISIFVSHVDKVVLANRGDSRGESSTDEVLLPLLEQALEDPSPRKLILVHLLGAHPAYYYRYPKDFARFNHADDAVARGLTASGRAPWAIAMRNFYDNALLYGDHVLRRSIELCRASGQPVAWLYAPDHGQDAAHYTNFSGHNARARSQYEIPLMFWRSGSFLAPLVGQTALAERPYQTDLLDHTLLGLMGITGDYYDPRNDLLSPAFEPTPRMVGGQPWVADTNRSVATARPAPH